MSEMVTFEEEKSMCKDHDERNEKRKECIEAPINIERKSAHMISKPHIKN